MVSLKKIHPLQFNKNADFIKNWTGRDSLPDNARYSMGREQWSHYMEWCRSIGYVFDDTSQRFKEVANEETNDVGRNRKTTEKEQWAET